MEFGAGLPFRSSKVDTIAFCITIEACVAALLCKSLQAVEHFGEVNMEIPKSAAAKTILSKTLLFSHRTEVKSLSG